MARTRNNISETNNKIESVACYIRVSTEEQAMHGISLAAQEEKLRTYAENNNMRIVGWYKDEGVSGRKPIKKRPELQRMIQDAEKGMFERILFVKLDRFFRSVAEYYECMKRIEPVIWTATEEKYDLSNANGRFFVTAKLAVAEMEADQTGERIRMVNDHKVTTGQPLTGSMPFGFMIKTDKLTGRKSVIKKPDEEHILSDVIEHYMTHQSKKKTLIYIHTKYDIDMPYKSLSLLLRNSMLYGEYRGNPNYCEAYINKETFDMLQKILDRNIKQNTANNRTYIFTGLVVCPFCGLILKGSTLHEKRAGKTLVLKKYRCMKNRQNHLCDFNKVVNEIVLERQMLAMVEKCFEDEKIKVLNIQDSNTFKTPQKSIDEINERIDRLNYSWQTGKIRTVEQYEKQYADLAKELEEAKKDQQNVVVKDFSKIEAILQSGWKEIYNALDEEHKRTFWRSFVKSIEIDWNSKEKKITKINFI